MKKITILITVTLILGFALFRVFSNKSSPTALMNNLGQVLGVSTDATQQFKDAGSKVGFHVYYPASLPMVFRLTLLT